MNVQRAATPTPVVATPLTDRIAPPGGLAELFEIDLFRQAACTPAATEDQARPTPPARRRPTDHHPKA